MDIWLVAEVIIVLITFACIPFRHRLGKSFTAVVLGLNVLLLLLIAAQWTVAGTSSWTLALCALAIAFMAVEMFRMRRTS